MTKWRYIIRISANANNRDHDRYGAEMCMKNTNDRDTDCNTKSDSQTLCAWISRRDADNGQSSVYGACRPGTA